MTYKAIGRSVANYGAPVWSTNASVTSIGKIQIAQNEALRIATGSHKMSSIDHLHNETEMLTVKQHSDLLSAQYLVQCLDPDHVCHNIMDVPPRQMKHTLHTRHYPTVQPLLAATKKETLQAVHTEAVVVLLSTHSSLIIGGSPLLLSYGGSPPASPASHLAGPLRRRDPSTNPGPIAWWISVGN